MKSARMKRLTTIVLAALALVSLVSKAPAQTGDGYDLSWLTVDSGGGSSSSDGYTLSGTIGQFDVGAALNGGDYTLVGGFWSGAISLPPSIYFIYLPSILK